MLPDLGGLPLAAQATAWASADVMVFPHGAAMVGALFMKPGSVVVELWGHIKGWEKKPLKEQPWLVASKFDRYFGLKHLVVSKCFRRLKDEWTLVDGARAKEIRAFVTRHFPDGG